LSAGASEIAAFQFQVQTFEPQVFFSESQTLDFKFPKTLSETENQDKKSNEIWRVKPQTAACFALLRASRFAGDRALLSLRRFGDIGAKYRARRKYGAFN